MKLKQTLILAVIISLIGITVWEFYWRSQGYIPDIDDDKHLWAKTRAKVEKATENDVVLIGSSRVLFNIQVHEWEALTGIKPIQLAMQVPRHCPLFMTLLKTPSLKEP